MKRILTIILCSVLCLAASSSIQAQINKLNVTGARLLTVNPVSLTSADGTMEITIVNKGVELKASDIEVALNCQGKAFLSASGDKFTIKKGTQTYTVKYKASLTNPMDLVNIIRNREIKSSDITTDLSLKIAKKKKAKAYSFKNISLSSLMKE